MSDEDFPLGCGPCHAPLAVQRSWVDAHSFGVLSEDYADPPQNITSCRIADRSISHRQRTFDFKIKTDSNSILDRIQHVEDVGELARVLSSTSCGCTLYAGGCPKAVKSFVGSDWDDRIRAERMKRYTGKPPTKVASDLTRQAIRENTVDGVFQPTFLGLPVCRDVWLYLSHTSQSNYQRIMREINLTPTEKLEQEMQHVTARMNKTGAHHNETAKDNQCRWLRTKITSRIQNPPNRSNEATEEELQLRATEDNPDAAQTSNVLRKPPLSTWYQSYLQVRILTMLFTHSASHSLKLIYSTARIMMKLALTSMGGTITLDETFSM
jgi:hypothetical protein